MAYTSRLELQIDSRTGERNLQRVRGELDQTERRGTRTFGNLRTLALGFAGALSAIGATSFFRTMLAEQQEVERNLLRTTQLLESTGAAAWTTAGALDAQARGLARATLQNTQGVQRAQQVMLTFRAVTEETFDRSIELAADLATVMGGDITSAAQQLGRALEDPERGVTALRRSGVSFTEAQRDMISSLVETNQLAEAQALILDELAAQLGGVARREAEGLAGAFDTLGQANLEAREQLADYFDLAERSTNAVNTLAGVVDGFTQRLAAGDLDGIIRSVTGSMQILAALAAGRAAQGLATYTAAKVAAAGATFTLNGALVTLRTTMLTLFGPVGIAVAAAGILFSFREELAGTASQSRRTAERVDDLTNAINTNSEAAVRSQLVNLTGQMFDLERQAIAAREEVDRLTQDSSGGSGALGIAPGRTGEQARAIQELGRIAEEQSAVGQSADRLRSILEALRTEGTTPTVNSVRDLASGTNELAQSQRDAIREADQFARSFQSLYDRLRPLEASQRQYREEQEMINQALATGIISLGQYNALLGEHARDFRNAGDAATVYGLHVDTGIIKTEEMSRAAQDMGWAFSSAFEDAILEGENLRGVMQGLLDDIIRIALRTGVTQPLGQAVAGAMGGFSLGGMFGFANGGYTGAGGKYDPAGIVHAGEFVIQKSVVEKPGVRPMLESLNKRGYANGGYVGPTGQGGGGGSAMVNVHITTPPGTEARTEERQNAQGGRDLHVIIDEVTAQNISTPGSRTSRAMRSAGTLIGR